MNKSNIDFQKIFNAAPGRCLVLATDTPRFTILAASDAYLHATKTRRDGILGKGFFEVFPDNPEDTTSGASGSARESFARVVKHRCPDVMDRLRYCIHRPASEGCGFEERFWKAVNYPVPGDGGKVAYIIHQVEDVAEPVRSRQNAAGQQTAGLEPDNSTVLYNSANVYVRDGTVAAAAIARGQDITERKEAAKALQEIQALLTAVTEGSPNPIFIKDRQCRLLMANPATLALIGKPAWEVIGKDDSEHYGSSEASRIIMENDRRIMDSGQAEVVEETLFINGEKRIFLSNKAPWRDSEGNVIGLLCIAQDITEQKRKAEDLLASERELLKVTIDSLGEGVVAMDQEERIIFINQTAAALSGYSCDEATGKPLHKIVDFRNDRNKPVVITASSRIARNLLLVTRDLRTVPIFLKSSPIKTADGPVIGTVVAFSDISEKLKTEQELLKTEKLQSLGVLAGGIAHDFNNMLAAVLANIQLAKIKLEKGLIINKYLDDSMDAICRAKELTDQLLTFSKGGAPVKKTAALGELVRNTVEFTLRGSNIKTEFYIPEDLAPVEMDSGQISQVINNLIINAKQAMPEGGVIRIDCENVNLEFTEIPQLRPGDYVTVSITDQGNGIPLENLSKVFDPYFSTKKKGSGLGLSICYSIIQNHGGYIGVESMEGSGSTFYFYLPATEGRSCATAADSNDEFSGKNEQGRILIMDDEVTIIRPVSLILQDVGYEVDLAVDGTEAVMKFAQACREGKPYDVVLLDLTIPGGMGGKYTIKELMKINPKVKAIVCSGYSNDPVLANPKKYHFREVVTKPFKMEELRRALIKVINEK